MNFKSANIKTVEEALTRMIAGEVFYTSNNISPGWYPCFYKHKNRSRMSQSPFRMGESGNSAIGSYEFNRVTEWKLEKSWEDSVSESNAALCICWDGEDEPEVSALSSDEYDINFVVGYNPDNSFPYSVYESEGYRHARLVNKDDLFNNGFISVEKGK